MTARFAAFDPDAHGRLDPQVAVREARAADVVGIVAVEASRGELSAGFAGRLAAAVDDDDRCVLVGLVGPVVVGWASMSWWSGHADVPDGYAVSSLTVAPQWRRRRVGDRLLGAVLDRAWERTEVLRSVVNARNRPSIVLHERHGFVSVAQGPELAGIRFDGGTGILMQADRARVRP